MYLEIRRCFQTPCSIRAKMSECRAPGDLAQQHASISAKKSKQSRQITHKYRSLKRTIVLFHRSAGDQYSFKEDILHVARLGHDDKTIKVSYASMFMDKLVSWCQGSAILWSSRTSVRSMDSDLRRGAVSNVYIIESQACEPRPVSYSHKTKLSNISIRPLMELNFDLDETK